MGARVGLGFLGLLAALWGVVHAVEAEKELRVLCGMAEPGVEWSRVEALFRTAEAVSLVPAGGTDSGSFPARSAANGGLSSCSLAVAGGQVQERDFVSRISLGRLAAVTSLTALSLLVAFQLLLAAGLPLGRLAWGGEHERLPPRLRVGSALSALLLVAAGLAVAEWAGWLRVTGRPPLVEAFLTGLVLLFALSTLANLASSSRPERWTGAPLAFLLTCSLVALVLSGGAG